MAAARPFCKIIAGISGRDLQRTFRLAALYQLAGADWLDVAADASVVQAAQHGIAWAKARQTLHKDFPHTLQIMVSIGVISDPHVGAALIDSSICATCSGCVIPELKACADRPLSIRAPECPTCLACIGACPFGAIALSAPLQDRYPDLQACLDQGISGVELHVSGADPADLQPTMAALEKLLPPDMLLSLSVGAMVHDAQTIVKIAQLVKHRPKWLLQVEGEPMRGAGENSDADSLQLVREVLDLAPSIPCQIAGGTGLLTAKRCVDMDLPVIGVGFGTTARLAVAAALATEVWALEGAVVEESLKAARALVLSSRARDEIRAALRPSLVAAPVYRSSYAPKTANEIKMNHNEAPSDVAPELKRLVLKQLAKTPWHQYRDADGSQLRQALALHTGHLAAGISVGHGANELIHRLLTSLDPQTLVVLTAPDYYVYSRAAQVLGLKVVVVPLERCDDTISLNWYELMGVSAGGPALLLLSQPNNPTGTLFDASSIHGLLNDFPGLVVLDEAYADFSGASHQADLKTYRNLLLLRTLSKGHALAGLRLGYMLGAPRLISQLDKLQPPYPISELDSIAAQIILQNPTESQQRVALVIRERQKMTLALRQLDLLVFPSQASFLLFDAGSKRPAILAELAAANIAVRDMGSAGLLADCIRISIGTEITNDCAIQAIARGARSGVWVRPDSLPLLQQAAIILDLDGVIVDVRKTYRQAYLQGIAWHLRRDLKLQVADKTLIPLKAVHLLRLHPGFNAPLETVAILLRLALVGAIRSPDQVLTRQHIQAERWIENALADKTLSDWRTTTLDGLTAQQQERVLTLEQPQVALERALECYFGSAQVRKILGINPVGSELGLAQQDAWLADPELPPIDRQLAIYTGRKLAEVHWLLPRWRRFDALLQKPNCDQLLATADQGQLKPDGAPLEQLAEAMNARIVLYIGDLQADRLSLLDARRRFPKRQWLLGQVQSASQARWPDADIAAATLDQLWQQLTG